MNNINEGYSCASLSSFVLLDPHRPVLSIMVLVYLTMYVVLAVIYGEKLK
jgi:hypothetical protein